MNPPKIHPRRRKGRVVAFTYRLNGRVHVLSRVRSEAQRQADRLWGQHLARQPLAGEPVVVAELVLHWLREHPAREWAAKKWASSSGTLALADLPIHHLDDVAAWCRQQGFAASSIHEVVNVAVAACQWAQDRGYMLRVPRRPKLKPRQKRPKDIPVNELPSIFASLPERAGRLFRFMLESGCRPGEACRLQWSDWDEERGVIVLEQHKTSGSTGEVRTIYLPPGAVAVLRTVPRTHEHIFVSRLGRPYTPDGLRAIMRYHCRHNPYAFRHTFAQWLADTDYADRDIAKLLGQSNTQTVEWYRKVRDQRLRRVAANLVSPLPQQPSAPAADVADADRTGEQPPTRAPASDQTP